MIGESAAQTLTRPTRINCLSLKTRRVEWLGYLWVVVFLPLCYVSPCQ
jgi:hypothetical protein